MKGIFYKHANKGGIYRILNTENGRIYYGSTVRFKQRFFEHSRSLEQGTHFNKFLQRDYTKTGSEAFIFEVIEVIEPVVGDRVATKRKILSEEQKYIDKTAKADKGEFYNIRSDATDLGYHPKTEEQKKNMSEKMKEYYSNPEYRKQAGERAKKQWQERYKDSPNNIVVTNRDTGECVAIKGSVREFCIEKGLSYKSFNQLLKNKIKSSGGWFLGKPGEEPGYVERKGEKRGPMSDEERRKRSNNKFLGAKLIDKHTKEVVIIDDSLKRFALKRNLSFPTLSKVLNGKGKSVGNLMLKDGEHYKEFVKKKKDKDLLCKPKFNVNDKKLISSSSSSSNNNFGIETRGGSGKKETCLLEKDQEKFRLVKVYESAEKTASVVGVASSIIRKACVFNNDPSIERLKLVKDNLFIYKENLSKFNNNLLCKPKFNDNDNKETFECKACTKHTPFFSSLKGLATHIQYAHKITSEEYTIRYLNNGIRPLCPTCKEETRYVSFSFKKYCKKHSRMAESEGGRKGGRKKKKREKSV